jgi:hypothetical protein
MSEQEVQETVVDDPFVKTAPVTPEPETEEKDVDTNASINSSLEEIDDPETLKKIVKKLRNENAKTRTNRQAEKAELEEFRKWQLSQKSETEKLRERAEQAEQERLEALREAVLAKYGIDESDDLAEFVTGTNRDELESRAKKIAERLKTSDATSGLFNTPGSSPVKKKASSGGEFLRGFIS